MIQLWYPAQAAHRHLPAPWMSPGAVPFFEREQGIPPGTMPLPTTHAPLAAAVDHGRCGRPVVLYSPGLRSDRRLGTVLIEELLRFSRWGDGDLGVGCIPVSCGIPMGVA
jgi:hypothetical protein